MSYARVIGTGSYLPERVLTNAELARSVDTSDEWIVERTGIRQRHIAAENEFVSDLALHASKKALRAAHIDADRIDLIVLATSTPDMIFPSSACLLQAKLGIKGGAAFDVQAVCSGFVYAMATAEALMRGGQYRYALVVGAEVFSRILNWQDRTTCVLFGDGAGACVLARSESAGVLSTHLHADGSHAQMLHVPGSVCGGKVQGTPFLTMDGQGVFKFAVRVLDEVAQEALRANDMSVAQLDWVIPHQANVRIIDATAKKMGLPHERMLITVDRHANTSAASIPLAFDQGVREGRVKPGQHIMMLGVGGGFTWGSVLLRY